MATVMLMDAGIEAFNCGSVARIRSTVSMMLAPGCRKIMISTAGLPLGSRRCADPPPNRHVAHIGNPHRRAHCDRRHQRPVIVGLEDLVVGAHFEHVLAVR